MDDRYDLAQVGKVIEINGDTSKVEMGGGTVVSVIIGLVDARVGDYVLVHAGYVISKVDMEKALQTLNDYREDAE